MTTSNKLFNRASIGIAGVLAVFCLTAMIDSIDALAQTPSDVAFSVFSQTNLVCTPDAVGASYDCNAAINPTGIGQNQTGVAVGDINSDGLDDLAFGSGGIGSGPGNFVCYANGDGTFTCEAVPDAGAPNTGGLAIVDLNNDTFGDLVFANQSGNPGVPDSQVCLNGGLTDPGVFTCSSVSLGAAFAVTVTAADFDGVNGPDLLFSRGDETGDFFPWLFALCTNDGNGSFSCAELNINQTAAGFNRGSNDLESADMDNDGDLDIVISAFTYGTDVCYNDGSNAFECQEVVAESTLGHAIEDVNNDGFLDLVVTPFSNYAQLCLSNTMGSYNCATLPAFRMGDAVVVDFDSMYDLDLVFANAYNQNPSAQLCISQPGGVYLCSDILSAPGTQSGVVRGYFGAVELQGSLTGHLFEDTNGNGSQDGGEPGLAGVDVEITDALGVTTTVTTDANGDWTADGLTAGLATVDIDDTTLPAGATLTAGTDPTSITVVGGASTDAGTDGFQLGCTEDNVVTGTVSLDGSSSGVAGIAVELQNANDPMVVVAATETGADGSYTLSGATSDRSYIVMIVEPLGTTTTNDVMTGALECGANATVDFTLTSVVTQNNARSKGYWKKQFSVATGGKGKAKESTADLEAWIDEIRTRYTDPYFQTLVDEETDGAGNDLVEWHALLSVKGKAGMAAKAEAQVGALALNIMSLKVSQFEVVTDDGKTAGDVLTYSSELLTDTDPSNDEMAKDLAERVNTHDIPIEAGKVTPSQNIAYKHGDSADDVPLTFELRESYPNPFNPSTTVRFSLAEAAHVTIRVFDVTGREIALLLDGQRSEGLHEVVFDASNLTSGTYLARMDWEAGSVTRAMVLVK